MFGFLMAGGGGLLALSAIAETNKKSLEQQEVNKEGELCHSEQSQEQSPQD